jgi:enoyl-CoA hydratase
MVLVSDMGEGHCAWYFMPMSASEFFTTTQPLPKRFAHYERLDITLLQDGILDIRFGLRDGQKLPTADGQTHSEMTQIWRDINDAPEVKVALIRGQGSGFSAGGDLGLVQEMANHAGKRAAVWREARDLVYNLINCDKAVVSAMHGPAAGAGLVCGLLADISIATKSAKLVDAHTRLGVAAGDHAAIIWPLLCGMAKSKYYLMLCESVSGEEAERIGLVSLAVDEADLLPRAAEVCRKLATGSQSAIRWTKYSLNNWLRMAGPTFDASLALEMLGFGGTDVHEGVRALRAKEPARFDRDQPF